MSYIHTSTKGKHIRVHTSGDRDVKGLRYYVLDCKRMILPALPTTAAGRYNLQAMADAMNSRRAYRRIHDDYMLPTSENIRAWDQKRADAILEASPVVVVDMGDSIQVPAEATSWRAVRRHLNDGTWVHDVALDDATRLVRKLQVWGGTETHYGVKYRSLFNRGEN